MFEIGNHISLNLREKTNSSLAAILCECVLASNICTFNTKDLYDIVGSMNSRYVILFTDISVVPRTTNTTNTVLFSFDHRSTRSHENSPDADEVQIHATHDIIELDRVDGMEFS